MRRAWPLLAIAIAVAFAAGFGLAWWLLPRAIAPTELAGVPRILDGDTVEIAGERIRLLGIDAPETEQVCLDAQGADWRCGLAARDALVTQSAGRAWRCAVRVLRDRYGRLLGTCSIDDIDLERWMVRHGWALSYRRYEPHPYDGDEDAARTEGLGLWPGAFHAPWDWRHRACDKAIYGAGAVTIEARARLCRS